MKYMNDNILTTFKAQFSKWPLTPCRKLSKAISLEPDWPKRVTEVLFSTRPDYVITDLIE